MEEFTKLNKQETIAKLKLNGKQLEFVPQFKGDKDVVLAAVKQNGVALKFASEELRQDKEVVMAAVKQEEWALKYASEDLKGDKEFMMAAVTQEGVALEYASEELQGDKEVVLAAVTQNGVALEYASEDLQGDKEFMMAAVTQNGVALEFASDELQSDKEVVLAAVTQNGEVLKFASEELQGDKEVVLAAITQEGWALEYASEDLKADKQFMLAAVNQNGYALKYVSPELKGDKEFILAAVKQNRVALKYVSEKFKGDKEFILAAVKQNGMALQYVSEELKSDKEFMMAAVKQNGGSLEYASPELQCDKDVVFAAVTKNGLVLKYASEELKQDKEVVLAAVTKNGLALEYASEELKHDEEFIMDVVTKNKDFVLYVDSFKDEESKELLKSVIKLALSNDGLLLAKLPDLYVTEEMCVTAVRQNNYAYQYVPKRFLTPELVKLLPVRLGPPSLTRQVSETKSNQTSASTCSYHSMSRLFLQNRFIFVKPLKVDDIYDKNDCNGFLIPVNIETTGLDTLDDAKCSPGGYDKILLFLYIYFLLKETDSCKNNIGDIIPRQVDAIEMPDFLKRTKHEPRLLSLLREIKHLSSELRWKEYSFSFNTIEEPILFSVVQKLINLKFYVQLTCCGGREIHHAVTIVGVQESNYIIKNSWSVLVDIVPSIKFFYLKGWSTPWMGTELLIYIPIISSEPTDGVKGKDYAISKLTRFDAWLDDYTAEIQRKPKGGRKTKRKKGTRRIKHKRTKRKLK